MRQCAGVRHSLREARKSFTSSIAFTTALTIGINNGHAQTVIESSNTTQTLSTDTAYILNQGTTVVSRDDDAIIVNGIVPDTPPDTLTFSNAGSISNSNLLITGQASKLVSAIRFNVDGSLINQTTGIIFGDDRGVFIDSSGINSITNYGDISAKKGPGIEFGSRASGTIDNFGTINNGNLGLLTGSSRGIGIDTSGTVTINNHAGASIRSGPGPSPTAITVLSGNHFITNDGLIDAHRLGIQVTGQGSAQIINRGTITSSTGTAISLESNDNLLTLDTGSILNGFATSSGSDNHLRLEGSGFEDSPMTGFADLTMADLAMPGTWTLSGAIGTTGTAANTIDVQTGTLTLAGAVTTGNNGGATIATGAGLAIGAGGDSGSFTGNIVDNGVLTLQRSDDVLFPNIVSGTGSLVKVATGTATLAGANSYSGGTRLEGGVLDVLSDTSLGNAAGGLTFFGGTLKTPNEFVTARATLIGDAGGTIDVAGSSATFTGPISGVASLVKTNERVLTLTADNTDYTGTLTIESGTVSLGNGGATGTIGGNVINSGSLVFNRVTDLVFDGSVAGFGSIVKQGNNRLTLSGEVSSTAAIPDAIDVRAGVLAVTGTLATGDDGGTTVQSGATLAVGNGGSTGELVGDVVNLGAVVFDRATDLAYRETIIGPGTVAKQGAGTLTLLGNVASTGGVTIGGGVLQLGDGGNRGALAGNIANNASLAFNRSDSYEQVGVISGSGTVTQQGSGTTTLRGINSYSGLTRVNAGRLNITGAVVSPAQVATGATLGGTGSIQGALTVDAGGHVAPGTSIGTLNVGSLVLNAGSQLDFELGLPNIIGGTTNDFLTVADALTLDGTLNVTDVGGFSPGVYQIINYGGVLTNNGLDIGGVPERFRGGESFLISTTTPNQINLIVSSGGSSLQFWDGLNTTGNNSIDGGPGTWNTATTNWTNDGGSANTLWQGGFAVFQGASGAVALGADILFTGGEFRTDGYVIQGNGFGLQRGLDTIFNVDAGVTATIDAPIVDGLTSGGAPLTKEGGGTLILAQPNPYSGGTVLNAGTLLVNGDDKLGAATGGLTFNGGVLGISNSNSNSNSFSTGRTVSLNALGGTIDLVEASATFTGVISGAGALTKTGVGQLTLEGNSNSYEGGTFINFGTVTVASDTLLGAPAGGLTLNGGALNVGGGFTSARSITLGSVGGTLDTTGASATFTGTISGSGLLTKGSSTNTIILTGDNGYDLGTTISGGALQLGNGGITGSILGHVLNNGTLIFNRSDAYLVANSIDGTGGIEITGGGFAHLRGNNNYEGGTRITGGSTLIADFHESLGEAGVGGISMTLDSALVLTDSFALSRPITIEDSTQTISTFGEDTVTTISGLLSGGGLLRKVGAGTLNLVNPTNSYTGGTRVDEGTLGVLTDSSLGAPTSSLTLDGGTLLLVDGFTTARAVTLGAGGGTIEATGAQARFSGAISGVGALSKTGVGELALSGVGSSYAGGTFINAGTLTVATDSLLGATTGGLTLDGGTLRVGDGFTSARSVTLQDGGGTLDTSGATAAFTGAIAGPGKLTRAGSTNTIILTGANGYTGGTAIESGVLQIGNGGATGSILGDVLNDGSLIFNRSDAYGIANNISGAGNVTIQSGGIATLTGNNSFAGDLQVFGLPEGSTVIAEANTNLGSPTGNIILTQGSKLVLANSFEVTRSIALDGTAPTTIDTLDNIVIASGIISGTGTLIKEGIGTLIVSNANNQTGGAAINAGTVQVGGSEGPGRLNGDIAVAADATLVFALDNVVSFGSIAGAGGPRAASGVISGAGAVIQAGAGTLIATGVHDYTGTTYVDSGRLLVDGAIAGPAQVATGARLGGSGSIGGAVTIADGAILEPGASVGTLTADSLLLGAGSLLEYELGLPDIAGGINDLVNITGALTLDGTLNIVNAGGFSRGVYRLINYGGALTDNGLLIGGLPTRFVGSDMLVSTTTAGQVDLIVNSGGFGLQFWDGAGTIGNSAIDGGTATWTNTTTNWTADDGVVNAPWQGGFAVFQGAPGTVTLGELIAFEGMQFRTDGYVLEGGGFGLAGEAETLIRVDPLVTATINAPIADGAGGATRITKTDAGVLVLDGINTYTGGTVIEGGALQVAADANLGAATGALSLNGGTLVTAASFASGRSITLGENGGIFSTNSGTQLSLGSAIGGAGTLTKIGAGTLSLSGANSYTGGTVLDAGVLAVSADANLGAATGMLDFGGGTLRFDASFDPAASRAVVLETSGTIDTNGNNVAFAQGIVGSGALIKAGAGTLTLSGNNGYAGGTTIGAGTLQIGNGGTTGAIVGDIANNASLVFNRSDSAIFGGTIDGGGSFTKFGAGTLTLTGANDYAGGTTIAAGTLQVGDGATSGSLTGDIVDNGALVFSRTDAVTFAGAVSGIGSLSQMGTGTLTLGGINSHTGGTSARAGTIAVANDLNLGAAGIGLTLDGGTLLTTAAISSARPITLATNGGTIDNGGFADMFSGPIGGAGALTVAGAGTVTLTAENDYAGGTTIAAGTLQIGNGGATGSITGDVVNHGILTFARSNLMLFEDMISGSGAMLQAGSGTTILTASNSYLGGTTISAGTLQIGNGGTSGSIAGDIDNNTLLIFDRSDTLTYDGSIGGSGSLLQAGAGTTILTGANSYTGATTISAGTLQIGNGGTTGSIPGDVIDDGALVFNRADAVTFAGTISGSGMLSQIGGGTLTLAATNSHSGGTSVLGATLAVSSDLNLGAANAALNLDGGRLVTTAGIASQRLILLGAGGGTIDNGGFADLFSGPITGIGALSLASNGTVTLTADNNYAGGTTIAAGTLQLGNGGTTGSLIGDITNDGTLVLDRANALVLDGAISGTGAVIQQGSGTTTLAATSTYTGPTSVNNGRLLVDGTLSGDLNVASGARLGGTGEIEGTVTIGSGGHLAPGHSPGTLTVGTLLLDAGALLDYEFGLSDIVGGGINDLTIVSGALTLDGTLNLADAGGLNRGIYRIFEYGGVLTDNGLVLGSAPSSFSIPDLEISTAMPGEVNLIVSTGRSFDLQFWDGVDNTGNGIVDGGSGIWSAAATNWTGLSGSPNGPWQAGFAIFQGTSGTVTLGSAISFEGMQFRTNGYVIEGGGFDLTAVGTPIIRVDPSLTATINAPIAGVATLTKGGGGVLVLGGANSYAGGTEINGGTIRVARDANLGAAGALSLNSGTLETTESFATSRSVTLGEDGGTFSIGTGTQLALDGVISGAGVLGKTGAGTLNLTGANNHTGGTLVSAGMLLVSSDANLGATTAPLVLNGGTLGFDASFDPVASRPIGLGALGGTIDTRGNTSTFAQGIGGTGALTKQGAGTLILTAANSYSGGTTISAGSLQIGNGGTTGSLLGDINNNSALSIDRADKISYAGVISGSGSLTQAGTGTTVLTGENSYTGGTLISAGTLQIGNGGTSGSIGGDVTNNGALVFSHSNTTLFGGTISGTGALRQEGSGTLTLTGTNTYSGPTTVVRGRLEVAGALGDTTVTVASGSTLSGDGSIEDPVTVTDGARLAPGPLAAPGTLSVGALTLAPAAQLSWRLGRPNIVGGRLNDVVEVAADLTLDGRLDITTSSDFAALPGSYRLIEYGGALTDAGLALGLVPTRFSSSQVQTAIPGQVNLVAIREGLAVQFWDSSDGLGNGQINGGAGVWSSAAANWTAPNGTINQQWVSSMAIFAGPGGDITLGEDVQAIALQFVGDGYRIDGVGHTLTFLPHAAGFGGLVRVDPEATAEIAAVIDGTTGLIKTDAGTLILTGANSYSGGTAIRGGTLQIGTGGTSGSIDGAVSNDGRLVFNRSDSVTFAGVISGVGTVEQNGGTLTLTGANSYAAGTSVRAGTLQIVSDTNIGGETGALLLDSASLRWLAAFDLAATRPITLGAGGGTLDTNGFDSAIDQRIGGAGGLAKFGAGRLTLNGHSDYAGPTAIAEGDLAVNGSIRSTTTVGPNGTLSGIGTVFGNVTNRGLIAPGNSIGTLTIAGGYVGEGGALAIETLLGNDNSPSDRLVIAGGAASGTTSMRVINLGGAGALTTGDGILVVDADVGGTTAANAFALAKPVLAGPYEYQLFRGGSAGANPDDWFLRSAQDPQTPSLRMETSLYATLPALALTYGRSLVGTLHERTGEIGGQHANPNADEVLWIRTFGRDGEREGKNGVLGDGPRYDYDYHAVQLGIDILRRSDASSDDFAGIYGAYGSGSGDVRHFTGARAGEDEFDADSIGAYWTRLWSNGWYVDGVVQGSWYDLKAKSVRLPELQTDGFGFAASIEGGRALQVGDVMIEPQAQLIRQTASLDHLTDAAAQIRFEDTDSLAGRIGARVAKTWAQGDRNAITLWGRVNLWNEFKGDTKTEFSSAAGFVPLHADLGGDWVEFNAGITAEITDKLSVHTNVAYETDFNDQQQSVEMQLGLRLSW